MVGGVGWAIIEIHKLLQFVIPKRKKERKKYENKKSGYKIIRYFYEITGS